MVREELQSEKLRCRVARSAWKYEKRLKEKKRSGLGRECREKMKKSFMEGKVISKWEKGRKKFWEKRGIEIREAERRRGEEERLFEELIWKDKEEQRGKRIREAKF